MPEASKQTTAVQWVTIDENNAGQRLDNFLLTQLKGVPRTWVYRVLRKGEVRVNKGRCKPAYRLQVDDVVRIPPLRQSESEPDSIPDGLAKQIEETIIYEDNFLIIVNKPAGLAVHGGSGVANGVIERLRAARPNAKYLELAHRLDRDTSGCLLIAKKRLALTELQRMQRANLVDKRYLALLVGRVRKGTWTTDLPLKKNTLKSGERIVRVDPQGKSAVTRFKVMTRYADATMVEAKLDTGRTHQIRVHAQANGTPILGDPKYGDDAANAMFREGGLRRLFLHARSLTFDLPGMSGKCRVEAPLPEDLQGLLKRLDEQEVPADRI